MCISGGVHSKDFSKNRVALLNLWDCVEFESK